jgi:glycosyltransferase involved in cell wall biosynthesis
MPRILFIAAHRPGRSPSQRYRFEQYFAYFSENGYECVLSNLISEQQDRYFYKPGKLLSKFGVMLNSMAIRLSDLRKASDFDIIFVQREAFMTGSYWFEQRFARSGARLIYDFDDSIWLLDTSEANRRWQWLKNPRKTSQIIKLSDLVIAGNNYLASYAKQFNDKVIVIPTTIDTALFSRTMPYQESERICIGWSGSITTIKHFAQAVPWLRKLKEKYGDRIFFRVMGDPEYKNEELGIKGIPWTNESEVSTLSTFDIGIMPLPDDEWVKGKCGLKGLSYMSLEIPTVMSGLGVNTEIIDHGANGFLASTDAEWIDCVSQLIDSFELRKRLGAEGRRTVVARYSVDSQKSRYLDAFNALLKR